MSAVTPGTRLGAYEIVALIGAGGMGEVYRARDTNLGREVAIKVLPPGFARDADRLRRFVQEAQAAAALDHPNILAIYQTGQHDNAPFIVSELLKGSSLRELLRGGPLPVRKAIDYAIQIARGLAAAHERGIVHRDLKPDNVFVTEDGRVKILDFGVAKLLGTDDAAGDRTMTVHTGEGTVLGTVGYMSPEQLRGQPIDGRSDVFSLGAVLYEMLSGRRAFHKDSNADTVSAVLNEDPPEVTSADRAVSPNLDRILRRCLEKSPQERFQSARDVAFALEDVSSITGQRVAADAPASRISRPVFIAAASVIVLVMIAAAGVASARWNRPLTAQPTFQPLTFRRGALLRARFAPDGETIVYGAAWDGKPPETFAVTAANPESRSLNLPNTDIYAVSSKGELALSFRTQDPFPPRAGVLARAPLLGGAAPREIRDAVEYADWGPDGAIAVTLDTGIGDRLEYPIGTPLYATNSAIHLPRVSPDGKLIAFTEPQEHGNAIVIIDRAQKRTTLAAGWLVVDGLAWTPSGDEVWFSAKSRDGGWGIYAASRAGSVRVVLRTPGRFYLHDIARDGRALVSEEKEAVGIRYMAPGADHEQDLSWLDASVLRDLSPDGRNILFTETGDASGPDGSTYLRKTDGSPAVRLGSGIGWALSPDSGWVLASARTGREMSLIPTGPGSAQRLRGDIRIRGSAVWLPDGKHFLFAGVDERQEMRWYLQDVSGQPRPISPGGELQGAAVSPDGRLLATAIDRKPYVLKIPDGAPEPLRGVEPGEVPVAWTADGRSVFVERPNLATSITRVDFQTGARTHWKTLQPADSAGVTDVWDVRIRDDGRTYAYSYSRRLSQLYLITGLR